MGAKKSPAGIEPNSAQQRAQPWGSCEQVMNALATIFSSRVWAVAVLAAVVAAGRAEARPEPGGDCSGCCGKSEAASSITGESVVRPILRARGLNAAAGRGWAGPQGHTSHLNRGEQLPTSSGCCADDCTSCEQICCGGIAAALLSTGPTVGDKLPVAACLPDAARAFSFEEYGVFHPPRR